MSPRSRKIVRYLVEFHHEILCELIEISEGLIRVLLEKNTTTDFDSFMEIYQVLYQSRRTSTCLFRNLELMVILHEK